MRTIDNVYDDMTDENRRETVRKYYKGVDFQVQVWFLRINEGQPVNGKFFKLTTELKDAGLWNPEYDRLYEEASKKKLNESELYRLK